MSNKKIFLVVLGFALIFVLALAIYPEILSYKVISYLIVALGLFVFVISKQFNNTEGVFAGSFIFFSGIILYVISSFNIWNPSRMIFPALLLSSGLSLFISFLNNKKIYNLIFSVILLLIGLKFFYKRMSFKIEVFFNSLPQIFFSIGLSAIIILILLLIIKNKEKDENVIE
jgi:magnesium-transporting ATPase (P-type)